MNKSIICDSVLYPFKMLLVAATFPISLPLIFILEGLAEAPFSVLTPPWTIHRIKMERVVQEEKDKKEAYKKTYKYKYSQSEEAIKSL
jgi:hypothetical protein